MRYKLTLTIFMLTGSLFSLQAREISLIGGLNFSNMTAKSDHSGYAYQSRVGGHIGGLFGFNAGEKISLQTGLLLSTKGFKEVTGKWTDKFKLTYLEVPLLASYNYEINGDFKVYGGLGPVLGVAIGGKNIEKDYEDTDVWKISFGNNGEYKRLDVGLMIQAGAQYDKYRLGLFFNHGLLNIYNSGSNNYRERNRVFGISAAYVINLKK